MNDFKYTQSFQSQSLWLGFEIFIHNLWLIYTFNGIELHVTLHLSDSFLCGAVWKSVSHTHVSTLTRITGWHCRKKNLTRMCSACAENDASFQSVTCMWADYKFALRRLRPALTWNWAFLGKYFILVFCVYCSVGALQKIFQLIIGWTPSFAITLRLTILELHTLDQWLSKQGLGTPRHV